MDEFYASGGTTSFADRVSAALGIHASQVKVVAVYKGSVVVEYLIEPTVTSGSDPARELRKLETKLNAIVKDKSQKVFGAPVLSATTDGDVQVEDPTYNPTANVNQPKNPSKTTPVVKPAVQPTPKPTTITAKTTEPQTVTIEEEVPVFEQTAT